MLLALTIAAGRCVSAQTVPTADVGPQITIPHVKTPPTLVDAIGGAEVPGVVTDFRQNQPGDGSPASLPTKASVSYDDHNLYIVFECLDDGTRVRAGLTRRENIGDDDQVLVYLDTFRDQRRAYVFAVNPLGVQRDGILTEGQGTDYGYDTIWRSDAKLTVAGYRVLIVIPFGSIRFPDGPIQTWHIALGRYIARTSEYSYWPFITNRVAGFVNQMADLGGIRGIAPGEHVAIVPYAAFTNARYLDPAEARFVTSKPSRMGADVKLASRAATLDVTVNPDFAQVESDDPQVTINQRFEVFVPEKRPFFLENAAFFSTPENLLFSRRLIDPQFGIRVTAKEGGWLMGALAADDRAPTASTSGPPSGPRAEVIAGRLQREIGRESYAGILVTDRELPTDANRVFAADTRLKLSANWTFAGELIQTADRFGSGGREEGSGVNATLTRNGRHFTYKGSYVDRGPGFNAPLGFIDRVDIRKVDQYTGYYWRPGGGDLLAIGPALSTSVAWNHLGLRQDWSVQPQFDLYFRHQYGLSVWHGESDEGFRGVNLRERNTAISFYSGRSRSVSLGGGMSIGSAADYLPPPGIAPFVCDSRTLSAGAGIRPGRRLRVDETYYYTHLDGQGRPVFTNQISRTKVNIQLTRELSVRGIVDYSALVPNPALIQDNLAKRLTNDLLLAYLVNPFTSMYVGYTEGRQNLAIDSAAAPQLRVSDTPSLLTARQLFLKISYRLGL
jgi:hypothetical protein